jgi:uncharacterized membrane protein YidH (DUF202 family)
MRDAIGIIELDPKYDVPGPAASPTVSRLRKSARNNVMNRNILLVLIVVLAVAAAVAGYLYYQERQSGIDIKINENGVSIDGK